MFSKSQIKIGDALQSLVGAEIALKEALLDYYGTPVETDLKMALIKLMETTDMLKKAANRTMKRESK